MSSYFLKKTWGWNPDTYPALGFKEAAGAQNLMNKLRGIDGWVVVACTQSKGTPERQRGRMMGVVRLKPVPVDVGAVLDELGTEVSDGSWDEDGRYIWRFGLPMLEAHAFVRPPLTRDVVGVNLQQRGVRYAYDLASLGDEGVRRTIEGLKTRPVTLAESKVIAAALRRG